MISARVGDEGKKCRLGWGRWDLCLDSAGVGVQILICSKVLCPLREWWLLNQFWSWSRSYGIHFSMGLKGALIGLVHMGPENSPDLNLEESSISLSLRGSGSYMVWYWSISGPWEA